MEHFFRVLFIHYRVPHDREGSKDDVIHLVDPAFIKGLPTKSRHEAKPVLRHNEGNILVEHINNEECVTPIGFSAMIEHKCFQKLELADCVVGRTGRLFAF